MECEYKYCLVINNKDCFGIENNKIYEIEGINTSKVNNKQFIQIRNKNGNPQFLFEDNFEFMKNEEKLNELF